MAYLAYKKYIRDNVHQYVGLTAKEVDTVSRPIFQRLRHIRQMSTANMTYPGATHSRFEHSLGTMHVAGTMAESVVTSEEFSGQELKDAVGGLEDSDVVQRVRLAALLHDLGHPPLSHICEPMLGAAIEKSSDSESVKKFPLLHPAEYATVALIETSDSAFPFTSEEKADVLNIFHPPLKTKGGD